jgi:hypothetical protein
MADNQIVQIDFKFDLGNVPASTKAFSNYLKDLGVDLKFTKASTDALAASVSHLATAQTKAATAGASAANTVKKSNQQYTNFALILQDLPYGFRGIQNNLPAVIGGFAGMTGPIYLATSALIAFFTAYDMGAFKSFGGASKFQEAHKKITESVKGEATEILLLVEQYKKINTSSEERAGIVKRLNSLNPEYFGNLDKETTSVNSLNKAYTAYVDNLGNVVKAKMLEEELSKNIQDRLKFEYENGIAILKSGYYNPEYVNKHTKALKEHGKMLEKEATLAQRITDLSKVDVRGDTSGNKDQISKEKAANEARNKSYLDTLDERGKKEYQALLDLEENLATMKAAGFKDEATHFAAYKANMGRIAKEYDDKEYKRNQDSINANIDFETKIYNDSNRAFAAIKKEQADNEASFAKKQTSNIETELNIQERLNRDSLVRRIDFTKQALAKVAVIAAMSFNPNTIGVYLDSIDKLNAKLKGYGDQWNVTAKSINDSIQNFVVSSFTLMGESLGKALAGENVDVFNAFAMLIADALTSIGTSLISYATMVGLAMTLFADPLTWPIALAAGIAAVAAGAFLRSKISKKQNVGGATAFANGGIVSGPTMGLIGEYPGAKSNPEVVAPLDKLKDMLGGNGGGQFVLRGNDLVLALNRSEKSLNLRNGA